MWNAMGVSPGRAERNPEMSRDPGTGWQTTVAATPAEVLAAATRAGYSHTATDGRVATLVRGAVVIHVESVPDGITVAGSGPVAPAGLLSELSAFERSGAASTLVDPPSGSARLRSTMGAPKAPSGPTESGRVVGPEHPVDAGPFAPIPPVRDASGGAHEASSPGAARSDGPDDARVTDLPPPPAASRVALPGIPPVGEELPPPPTAPAVEARPSSVGSARPEAKAAPTPAKASTSFFAVVLSILSSIRTVVYTLLIVGAVVGTAYFWLNGYRRPASLAVGACITGIPRYSNVDTKTVECTSKEARYKVESNSEARDGSYPSNIASLEAGCEKRGGTATSPAKSAWDDGDHKVICLKRVSSKR